MLKFKSKPTHTSPLLTVHGAERPLVLMYQREQHNIEDQQYNQPQDVTYQSIGSTPGLKEKTLKCK